MSILRESQPRQQTAPNAILEHMRRRISRVGLLVAVVSTVLVSLVIFIIYAYASLR
ncbi:MAG: hypothetical protein ACYC3I_06060 [Gemmataceae bacterium]